MLWLKISYLTELQFLDNDIKFLQIEAAALATCIKKSVNVHATIQ